MPRLSIVIPCVQDAGRFETTLASVLQNRPDDCEILVVQPRSYDDPYELKAEVRFVEGPSDFNLIELLELGVGMAGGEIVHILSCDVEVEEGWTESALSHFQEASIASVSPLVVDRDTRSLVLARGVRYSRGGRRQTHRARLSRRQMRRGYLLGPTLAAGFFRRQSLVEVGGFRADVGHEWADVDISLRLRAAGYRCLHDASSVIITRERLHRPPVTYQSGREAEKYFWCRTTTANRISTMVMHTGGVAAELVGNLTRPQILLRMFGRVAVYWERKFARAETGQVAPQTHAAPGGSQPVVPLPVSSASTGDSPVNPRARPDALRENSRTSCLFTSLAQLSPRRTKGAATVTF